MLDIRNIKQIIDSKQTETAYVDYKDIPYLKDKYYELARDVVAMLNSVEAKGHDKYIICGISDDVEIIGIERFLEDHQNEKIDDANYQSVFDKIQPRPFVTYVQFDYLGHTFGCIYIDDKLNNEKLYEIKQTVKNVKEPIKSAIKGLAYTRFGTSNRVMMQEDRERVISIVRKPISDIQVTHITKNSQKQDALINAIILSFWDERNTSDIAFIESITDMLYADWIVTVRELRGEYDEQISFNGYVWRINNRDELIKLITSGFYNEHLLKLKDSILTALVQYDHRYDLDESKRYMSNVITDSVYYSSALLEGVFSFLAYLSNNKELFPNITDLEIRKASYEVVNTVLSSTDWRRIASIKDQLMLIAEIHPQAFLQSVENGLLQNDTGLYEFVSGYEESVLSNVDYAMSLFYALQVLAYLKEHFSKACYCMFLLCTVNKKMVDYLKYLLLPWYPMTEAEYTQRVAVVKQFQEIDGELSWKLIYSLLPNVTTTGGQRIYPKYIECKKVESNEIPETFWTESQLYYDIALELSRDNAPRLKELLNLIHALNEDNIRKLLDLIISSSYPNEKEKNDLFDLLTEIIEEMQDDEESGHENSIIIELQKAADVISPSDMVLRQKRLFESNQKWRKIGNSSSYNQWNDELHKKRREFISECYNTQGINGISRCLEVFEDSQQVAQCLFESVFKDEIDSCLCTWLDSTNSQKVETVRRYIHLRYTEKTDEWVKGLVGSESFAIKASFLCSLDITNETIRLVEELIDEEHEELYWNKAFVINVGEDVYRYVVEHLKKVNRYDDTVELLYNLIHRDIEINPQIVLDSIMDFPPNGLERQHTAYIIVQLNKWLEKNYENHNKVAEAELKCIKLFENYCDEPEVLFEVIASCPELFVDILTAMYRPANAEKKEYTDDEKQVAGNCFTILNSFKHLPGLHSDGFQVNEFMQWFDKVKELAISNDRYDVAMIHVGHILFYTPEDESGLFINKTIAELLHKEPNNSIREGYEIEAFNSIGVHYIDPTGNDEFQLEEIYNKRADEVDDMGYFRFAEALRRIAFSHHQHGVHIQERFDN